MSQFSLNDPATVAKIVWEFRSGFAWKRYKLLELETTAEELIKAAEICPAVLDSYNVNEFERRSTELRALLAVNGVDVPWPCPIPKLRDLEMARYGRRPTTGLRRPAALGGRRP